MKYCYCDIFY